MEEDSGVVFVILEIASIVEKSECSDRVLISMTTCAGLAVSRTRGGPRLLPQLFALPLLCPAHHAWMHAAEGSPRPRFRHVLSRD